jgi:NUMOD3 motif
MICKYYLYRHIRLDKYEPFYIGIGTKRFRNNYNSDIYSRAYDKNQRSQYWKNIIFKTDYKVEIIIESNNYEYILKKEKEFIKLYGRRDLKTGILVNLTEGGEGIVGKIFTEETRKKMSESRKDKSLSQETKNKISLSHFGKKQSAETKLKLSIKNKGKKMSEETKKKISIGNSKPKSEKVKLNQSNLLFPILEKEKTLELYNNGMNIKNISIIIGKSENTISRFLKKNNYVCERYTVMREDGLKFKTQTEACDFMKCSKGFISMAILQNKKAKGYKWFAINELIKKQGFKFDIL